MNRAALAFALLTILLLAGCGREAELTPDETTLTVLGQTAPGFEVVTLGGEAFDLESQRGKVVLINFFATWCPPCRDELPHLEKEIWQRFRDRPFALIVVGREEDDDVLRPFAEKYGYTFPIAGDPDRAAFGKYASQYIPRNVVVGPDGMILFQSQGFEKDEFSEMVIVIEGALGAMGAQGGEVVEAA